MFVDTLTLNFSSKSILLSDNRVEFENTSIDSIPQSLAYSTKLNNLSTYKKGSPPVNCSRLQFNSDASLITFFQSLSDSGYNVFLFS